MSVCMFAAASACTDSGASDADMESTGTEVGSDMAPQCELDMFDPNDERAAATPIDADTTLAASLCKSGDEVDWWTFSLSETSYVGVEVLFARDGQDLRLELWDGASGTLLERSQDGADIQAIHDLLGPGDYEVLVERRAGDPTYTLETYALSIATPPPSNRGATRVFCPRFNLDLQFEDRSYQVEMREDFGLEDAPDRWIPEAMLVRVLDEESGDVRMGWRPLNADGCTPPVWTPSPTDTQFVLQYALWSHLVRSGVPRYDCEQMQPCRLPRPYVGWTTAQGDAVQEVRSIASAVPGEQFREELLVYWAAAFSESRVSMGMDANLYARVVGSADLGGGQVLACPTGYCPNGAVCETGPLMFDHCRPKTRATNHLGGHPTLDIAADTVDGADMSGAPESKFTIAHELGHVQTAYLTGVGPSLASTLEYGWCELVSTNSTHTLDSIEWQAAAMVEGFADFYAVAVFNRLEEGGFYQTEDIDSETMRFQANCQAALDTLIADGKCIQPGDATSCSDLGASNETDWAGTLWDFTKVVGAEQTPSVLMLLSDAVNLNWDPGSTTLDAYNNMVNAAIQRFPGNGADFNAAAQANGTNR